VVSYLFDRESGGHADPRGVHCGGAIECGVEQVREDGTHAFDWTLCPLWSEFVIEGFLPR
jgi:hypothetical protein